MRKLIRRLRYWLQTAQWRRELDEELEFHRRATQGELERQGFSSADAKAHSRRALGNVLLVQEDVRAIWIWPWLDQLWQDVTFAVRVLKKNAGTTAIAVGSLGLGIGATTAVYSTVDWLLNRSPYGVVEPERLVRMVTKDTHRPEMGTPSFSYSQYEEVRRFQTTFVDVATYGKAPVIISAGDRTDRHVVEFVTPNYFDLLGLRPTLGRLITAGDDHPGATTVAVLSFDYWSSRFGGDQNVVGTQIRLNGQPYRVIGVGPQHFEGYSLDWNGPSTVFVPMHAMPELGQINMLERKGTWGATFFPIIGRLKPGITFEMAREQVQAWTKQLEPPAANLNPADRYQPDAIEAILGSDARIRSRDSVRELFGAFLVVCSLIVAASCFNVANFLLGRAVTRRREMAVRAALGASRLRVCRQLVTEALLISLASSIVGIFVAVWLVPRFSPIVRLLLPVLLAPIGIDAAIDSKMLVAAFVFGLLATLLFGMLPAVLASFRDPFQDLKNPRPHWSWAGFHFSTRQIILICQVALASVIAITAGLYARSFARASVVESGYTEPSSMLIARMAPGGLTREQGPVFYEHLLSRLNAMPQVVSASIGSNPPLIAGSTFASLPERPEEVTLFANTSAGPKYMETMGIAMLAGREYDQYGDANELLINRVVAQKFWPGENPVGRSMIWGSERRVIRGIVAADRCADILDVPHPCVWPPFRMGQVGGVVRIRTKGDPMLFVPELRKLVRELHPDTAITEAMTLDMHLKQLTAPLRISALATAGLAVLGLALLSIGCLSLFLSMVKDSVHEIAIRMALGANSRILGIRIVAQGLVLMILGLVIGIAAGIAVARQLANQLYRIEPTDSVTFVGTSILIMTIGLLSVCRAAATAIRSDPSKYLRAD
jgi:predicted permease